MKTRNCSRSAAAALAASMLCLSIIGCAPADPDPTLTSTAEPTVSSVPVESSVSDSTEGSGFPSGSEPAESSASDPTGESGDPDDPDPSVPNRISVPIIHLDPIDQARGKLEPSGALAGVLYLGYLEQPYDSSMWLQLNQTYLDDYLLGSIAEDRIVHTDGYEVYCIIPRDPASSVTVTEWNADTESAGKVLYESRSGEPILVQCNVSDIMPNLAVTITASSGETCENYHPCISLRDGSISTATKDGSLILDLSYPATPEGSARYHFDLCLPNEDYTAVIASRAQAFDLDEDQMLQILIENRLLPDTVRYLGTDYSGSDPEVQLSSEFEDYMKTLDEQAQRVFLCSFAHNWAIFIGSTDFVISVDGKPLQTQSQVYDQPISFYFD